MPSGSTALDEVAPRHEAAARGTRPGRRRNFRPDIEGLRAVAVLGVLIYHAGASWLPGGFAGVDVFFVISGFLITGLIHDEMERTGRLAVGAFYARRIKRLLPVAALVLVVTAIGSALVLSSLDQVSSARDIQSAALYVLNWRLAFQGTDYLAAAELPGPVQHYWSLCVEEQFYLFWPFVMIAAGWAARRLRVPLRPLAAVTLAVAGVASFAWCVRTTATTQPYAFFGTPSRVWELALGGVLALASPYLVAVTVPALRRRLAWAGLVAIVLTFVLLDASTPFPGSIALIPAVGTALVLFGGGDGPRGPVAVLGLPPMRWTGRISYSLYLWHWPLLVLGAAWLGSTFTTWQGLLVVTASAVPAYVTWRLLEEPFRRSRVLTLRPRRAFALAAVCMAAALFASLVPLSHGSGNDRVAVRTASGALVEISPAAASKDLPTVYKHGCNFRPAGSALVHCRYGSATAPVHAVLFGDSHALEWFPAVDALRRAHGWQLDVVAKQSCTPADGVEVWNYELRRPYPECSDWRAKALDYLTGPQRPDVVFVTARDSNLVMGAQGDRLSEPDSVAPLTAGLARTLQRLKAAGAEVVYIRDTPLATADMPHCIASHSRDLDRCAFSAATSSPLLHYEDAAIAAVPGVRVVDGPGLACPGQVCSVVSPGGVVTYRDPAHLSASYVRELAPAFARQASAGGALASAAR